MELLPAQVFLYTDQAKLVFHIQVPDTTVAVKTATQLAEQQNITADPCLGLDRDSGTMDFLYNTQCQLIYQLVRTLEGLRHEARVLVQSRQIEINALLSDISLSPRQKRDLSFGSIVGETLAWSFDLATASDVEQLRTLLRSVLDTTHKALSAWTVGQTLLTKVTKLTSARFDKIDKLLNLTRRSILEENHRMQFLRTSDYTAQRLINIIAQEIGELIAQLHEVESFYLAMKDLAHGKLSHHLIETYILQDHLDILAESIKTHNSKSRLIYPTVNYYYTHANVASARLKYRDQNTVIVIIYVPLTISELAAPMSIYQTHVFPLMSPNDENYHTILTAAPKFVLYNERNAYYSAVQDRQNLPCATYQPYGCLLKIPDPNIQLHSVTDNSCAMSLLAGDLQPIKKACKYHVIFGDLEPQIYQISRTKLFLVNVSSIKVEREGRLPPPNSASIQPISNLSLHININSTQSVYTMPCESAVHALGTVYLSRDFCDDWSPDIQLNVTYPYNMLILRHYFSNHTLLEDINAALELDYILEAELPKLPIETAKYDELLMGETESRIDFETAINASENQKRIYDSLTTYVWQKMLAMATVNSEFNVLSGLDWCLVLGMVVTVINSFVLTVLCLRFRALSMLLVGTKLARAKFIFTQPTLSTAQTSTLSADMIWQAIKTTLSDLVGLEAIMSLMFVLFFVSLLIRIFRTKQATATYQARLFLYLESANMSVKNIWLT